MRRAFVALIAFLVMCLLSFVFDVELLGLPSCVRGEAGSNQSAYASAGDARPLSGFWPTRPLPGFWPTKHHQRTAIVTYHFGGSDERVHRAGHGEPNDTLLYNLYAANSRSKRADKNFTAGTIANVCAMRSLSPSSIDVVVIVFPGATRVLINSLNRAGAIVVRAELLPFFDARRQFRLLPNDDVTQSVRASTFSKLWIFALTEYDTVLFLDSDALLMRNVADALIFNASRRPSTPDFIACAHGRPHPVHGSTLLQSGVLFVRPDARVFGELLVRFWHGDYAYAPLMLGDQSLLHVHFPLHRRIILPAEFNCRQCPLPSHAKVAPFVLHGHNWLDHSLFLRPLLRRVEEGTCTPGAASDIFALLLK